MKTYKPLIRLATICAFLALASVAVAALLSNDRPPGYSQEEWIELGDGFGIAITTTLRDKPHVTLQDPDNPDRTGTITPRHESTLSSQIVYGYLMIKRDGNWLRFQPELGPPRAVFVR